MDQVSPDNFDSLADEIIALRADIHSGEG